MWGVALGFMPAVMLLSAVVQNASGDPLPPFVLDPARAAALFGLFLLAATLEEIGWTGHAANRLHGRFGVVGTGVLIGAAAALWHLIPLLQVDRSGEWIAWWVLGTVARRVVIVWLYVHGGRRVFTASLFHAMSNLTWMLYPVMGSHFDPAVTSPIVVGAAALLVLLGRARGLR